MTNKEEYALLGRTFCDTCGNSDAPMDIDDDKCEYCENPAYLKSMQSIWKSENNYVFGEIELC